MKNNVKISLMMLCVGTSANILCMHQQYQQNIVRQDITNKVNNYVPKYDTSKEGAAAEMAKSWATPLSDAERVALIYQCYTLEPNEGANNDWPTRTATNLASAYAQRAKNFTSSLWKWISYEKPAQLVSGVTSTIGSYFSPAFRYAASFVRTPLKRLDNYLSTNKNAYMNQQNNEAWFNDVIRFAQEDFADQDVMSYLTYKQKTQLGAKIDLVVDKILPVMTESARNNGMTPLTRDEVSKWIVQRWATPAQQEQWTPAQQQQWTQFQQQPQQQQQSAWAGRGQYRQQ